MIFKKNTATKVVIIIEMRKFLQFFSFFLFFGVEIKRFARSYVLCWI